MGYYVPHSLLKPHPFRVINRLLPTSATQPFGPSLIHLPSGKGELQQAHLLQRPWTSWSAAALLTLAIALLYTQIAIKLFHDWIDFPNYSHGLLIPFFFLYILWDRRQTLIATPSKPTWAGLPLVALGLLVMLTGVFGAELFLSRFSFVLLAAGIVWTLFGWRMLLEWRFLLFILVLSIPLPSILLNRITFPLQLFASHLSSIILPLLGVPVLREGNVINLPALPLEVAEACSGIRSLLSLFTVAVLYGFLSEKRTSIRILLAFAALPIAIFANVIRIVGTGLCVQYWDPIKALGFFHEFSGWLLFLVSLLCLYLTHKILLFAVQPRRAT